MRRANDTSDHGRAEERGVSFGVLAALLVTLALHGTFLLFKKAPPRVPLLSNTPPMVALLPARSPSKTEKALLEWLDVLDPECFIKPNRACGFSLDVGEDVVADIPFIAKKRESRLGSAAAPALPVPTEPEPERLRELWRHAFLPITPVEPRIKLPSSEYPLWLLEDGSRLPQLFPADSPILKIARKTPPPKDETVLKTRFFDGDFFPEVVLEHSCGNQQLDAAAVKTLIFRGAALGLRPRPDASPVFISVKWKPSEK